MRNSIFIAIVSSLLVGELCLFFTLYFFGEHGYKKIRKLKQNQENIQFSVDDIRQQVSDLEKKLYDFKMYPYYKEKIIREQLQMIHTDNVIYKPS